MVSRTPATSRPRVARAALRVLAPAVLALAAAFPAVGCGGAPPPAPDGTPGVLRTGERVHLVRRGDTYSSIARLHGTTVEAIRRANPAVAPERLPIGTELRIPSRKPEVRNVERTDAP